MGGISGIIVCGERVIGGGGSIEVRSPYSGDIVEKVSLAGESNVDTMLDGAVRAFAGLKEIPSYARSRMLLDVACGMEERMDEFTRLIAMEAGKPVMDACAEVRRAVNTFTIAAEEAKRLGGEFTPLDVIEGSEKRWGITRRFPVGPVLAVTPFNFPLNLAAHKAAPAMAAGAPIIIKPSPRTPLTALLLGEVMLKAGWPGEAVSVVPMANELVWRLVEDSRVKAVSFTGSAAVGWEIKKRAASKKVTLELGGNAGVIIDEGVDLDFAVKRCVAGAFAYAGQVCISVQRIYAHKSVYDEFVSRFVAAARALKCGDPLDASTQVGPMIDGEAARRALEWVKEAEAGGARIECGGKAANGVFKPTVITGAAADMKICVEEAFAPIAVVERVSTFEDAVEKVNASRYGLQAGVFTRDIKRAFRAFEALDVGGVVAGDVPTFRADHMPYGGVKESGFGREGVRAAIEEITEVKVMLINLS